MIREEQWINYRIVEIPNVVTVLQDRSIDWAVGYFMEHVEPSWRPDCVLATPRSKNFKGPELVTPFVTFTEEDVKSYQRDLLGCLGDYGTVMKKAVAEAMYKLRALDATPAILRLCYPAYGRLQLYLRSMGLESSGTFLGLKLEQDHSRCFVMSEPLVGRFVEVDVEWKVTRVVA